MTSAAGQRVTYREVLGVPEFRALFLSQSLSLIGDQVARIALALLVYQRSGSAFGATATYASSYGTWLVGGPFLSALADRYCRRDIMIVSDIARGVLIAVLLVPRPPLWLVFAVLIGVGLLAPPFESARSAIVPDLVSDEQYPTANTLVNTTLQAAQVAGFFFGGLLVALLSVRGALVIDLASFAVSAVVLRLRLEARPGVGGDRRLTDDIREGFRVVRADPYLLGLLGYGVLATAVAIVPEGLAVAVAADEGRGSVTAGVLTGALPLGYILASTLLLRIPTERRLRWLPRMTLVLCLPLLLTPLTSSAFVTAVLWTLAGFGTSVQLIAGIAYVSASPREMRGRTFGIATTALMITQGVMLLVAGAVADVVGPRAVVAGSAAFGLAIMALMTQMWPQGKFSVQGKHQRRRTFLR